MTVAERLGIAPGPLSAGNGLTSEPDRSAARPACFSQSRLASGQPEPAPFAADSGYTPPIAPTPSRTPLPPRSQRVALLLSYQPSSFDCEPGCRHQHPELEFPGFSAELTEIRAWREEHQQ